MLTCAPVCPERNIFKLLLRPALLAGVISVGARRPSRRRPSRALRHAFVSSPPSATARGPEHTSAALRRPNNEHRSNRPYEYETPRLDHHGWDSHTLFRERRRVRREHDARCLPRQPARLADASLPRLAAEPGLDAVGHLRLRPGDAAFGARQRAVERRLRRRRSRAVAPPRLRGHGAPDPDSQPDPDPQPDPAWRVGPGVPGLERTDRARL